MDNVRKYVSLQERVAQAEQIARENGGLLPRFSVLMEHWPALAQAIARGKVAFSHIPREPNLHRKLEDHVRAAEEIAQKNNGLLPSYSDLLQMDRRLAEVVRDRPEAFKHILRARTIHQQKLRADRVAEAERLAEAAGGVLECTAEFQRQHNALVMYMRRHPDAFAHIPRRRRTTRVLEQHVRDAEALAASRGGSLPAPGALRKINTPLNEAIRRHRAAFAHIPREGNTRLRGDDLIAYVTVAEDLARQNGGILPHAGALRKLNNNLLSTIYRHPEMFAHIPHEVRDSRGNVVEIRNSKSTEEKGTES